MHATRKPVVRESCASRCRSNQKATALMVPLAMTCAHTCTSAAVACMYVTWTPTLAVQLLRHCVSRLLMLCIAFAPKRRCCCMHCNNSGCTHIQFDHVLAAAGGALPLKDVPEHLSGPRQHPVGHILQVHRLVRLPIPAQNDFAPKWCSCWQAALNSPACCCSCGAANLAT
jgi:hypothetical protein